MVFGYTLLGCAEAAPWVAVRGMGRSSDAVTSSLEADTAEANTPLRPWPLPGAALQGPSPTSASPELERRRL